MYGWEKDTILDHTCPNVGLNLDISMKEIWNDKKTFLDQFDLKHLKEDEKIKYEELLWRFHECYACYPGDTGAVNPDLIQALSLIHIRSCRRAI